MILTPLRSTTPAGLGFGLAVERVGVSLAVCDVVDVRTGIVALGALEVAIAIVTIIASSEEIILRCVQ